MCGWLGFVLCVFSVLDVDSRIHTSRDDESKEVKTPIRDVISGLDQDPRVNNRLVKFPFPNGDDLGELVAKTLHKIRERTYESEFLTLRRLHTPNWTLEDRQQAVQNVTRIERPDVTNPIDLRITCADQRVQTWRCGPESEPWMKRVAWDYAAASDCFKCPVNKCCLGHDHCWSQVKSSGNLESDYTTCDQQFESCVQDAYSEDEACQSWLLYFPLLVKQYGWDLRHLG